MSVLSYTDCYVICLWVHACVRMCLCVREREGICVDGAGRSVYMCECVDVMVCESEMAMNAKVCEGVKVFEV